LNNANPFTERGRISDPAKFTGRWREVSLIFDQIDRRRPVLIGGGPGIGRSSLLTHIAQSAGAVLEIPNLLAFSLDLAVLDDTATAYRLIARALGVGGTTLADVETGLTRTPHPVLIVLDNAQAAIAAGWGEALLEDLARLARRSSPSYGGIAAGLEDSYDLIVVATHTGIPPALSEPFAVVGLGAFAPAEVRLFVEAYLDGTDVEFSPATIYELARLSAGHPAYLQRAAYHRFIAAQNPSYDWKAHYLAEAREQPVPGAPLPPEAFAADGTPRITDSVYGDLEGVQEQHRSPLPSAAGFAGIFTALVPLLIGLVTLQFTGNWLLAALALGVSYAISEILSRRTQG
jgi:hypothetical protein